MNFKCLFYYIILIFYFLTYSCTPTKSIENKDNENPIAITSVAELESRIEKIFDASAIPGFSIAVIKGDKIKFQKALGYSDIESKQAFSKNSIQNIASISKTTIAVAIMKAVDLGKLNLDTDINNYLPFKVVNPHFPNKPITVRHLATHTSSILDTDVYSKSYYFPNANSLNSSDFSDEMASYISVMKGNKLIDESVFLKNALAQDGDWYSKDIFNNTIPGNVSEYSNIAATLAAYVVESATGISYEDFTSKYIFQPLGMDETSWNFETTEKPNFVSRYFTKSTKVPNYYLITKADGGLYTNTSDFSLFMMEMIRGYKGNGTILSKSGYTTMFSKQIEIGEGYAGGIFWELGDMVGFKHDGSDPGVTTFASYNSELDRGQILFTNIDESGGATAELAKIWNTVGRYDWSR